MKARIEIAKLEGRKPEPIQHIIELSVEESRLSHSEDQENHNKLEFEQTKKTMDLMQSEKISPGELLIKDSKFGSKGQLQSMQHKQETDNIVNA